MRTGLVHHIEIWVPNLDRATTSWGWLLETLGYRPFQDWKEGKSWKLADTYIVVEESPDGTGPHVRTSSGLNHLAFFAGSRSDVDTMTEAAASHGWNLLFSDEHPHAGGPDHYASYLENRDGFEVELVADEPAQALRVERWAQSARGLTPQRTTDRG